MSHKRDEFLRIYTAYIAGYCHVLDLFGTTFHDNAALDAFLSGMRRERKPLTNLLILPVQRYILLLKKLRDHTLPQHRDYEDIQGALGMITEITERINAEQQRIDDMSQCLQIQVWVFLTVFV